MSDSDPDRHPIDQIAEEFALRCRRGEHPSINDYATQHPDHAGELRELLPSIAMMERLKQTKKSQSAVATAPRLERLGDFRVVREVGRGGMGVVFEAVQESLGRRVALKVLSSAAVLDPTRLARFEQEARAAARLHHTNIIPVFGVGEQDGIHYIVMQFIDGQGLGDITRSLASGQTAQHAARLAVMRDRRNGRAKESSTVSITRRPSVTPSSPHHDANPRANASSRGDTEPRRNAELAGADDATQAIAHSQLAEPAFALSAAAPAARDEHTGAKSTRSASSSARDQTPAAEPELPATEPSAADHRLSADHWQWVARVGVEVGEALQYAHDRGTLHRDVKPSNLILDDRGMVWVADFGLAKIAEDSNVTRTGDIVGTLQYMSPEAFNKKVDARSDIYGLGLTLYELLTLRPPYVQASPGELIRQITTIDPPRPRVVNPAIPRDLETIVLKAIARDAADRYQTAGAMAEDLTAFLEDRPIAARRVSPIERSWRWCRRNRALAGAGAVAIASMLVAIVVGWVGYTSTRSALGRESIRRTEAEQATTRATDATARAEQNVKLSLAAFEEIFNQLGQQDASDDIGFGPPGERGFGEPGGREPGGRDPGGRMGPRRPVQSTQDAAVLQSILSFYDRFAQQNATNPALHAEAARSYRRVGDVYRWLGQDDKAEQSYSRSATMYEELFGQSNAQSYDYAVGIAAAVSSMAVSTDPISRQRQMDRLARAIEAMAQINSGYRTDGESGRVLAGAWQTLGHAQEMSARLQEAEINYRRALQLWNAGMPPPPGPGLASGLGRTETTLALSGLLSSSGRDAEARTMLEKAIAEMLSRRGGPGGHEPGGGPGGPGGGGLGGPGRGPGVEFGLRGPGRSLPLMYEELARVCRKLNDTAAAESATASALRTRQERQRGDASRPPGLPDGPRRPGPR